MNAKKINQRETPAMMEALEDRQLYAVSLTPSIPIPPPSPTSPSRLIVVTSASDPQPVQTNVVISIIAVLIGL